MVTGAYQKLETSTDPEVALQATGKRGTLKSALLGVTGLALLVAAAFGAFNLVHHHHKHHHKRHREPEKVGAGFLFYSEGDVLLLQRNSTHNNATWDVPGGNTEEGEELREAAEREATEEMGGWPVNTLAGSVLTKRGKHDEKWFTIYICKSESAAKDFRVKLSNESLDATWMPLKEALTREDLHPRLLLLFHKKEYRRQLAKTLPIDELDPHGEWPAKRIEKLQQHGWKHGDCPKKEGAGLLISSGGDVLLLLRNSKHNDKTWGLPGGNKEAGDADGLATARREATEEMGPLPDSLGVKDSFLTTRGKKGKKHYTVFVATVSEDVRASWEPKLNDEHCEARWFTAAEAAALPNLHPVVDQLFHKDEFQATLSAALAA